MSLIFELFLKKNEIKTITTLSKLHDVHYISKHDLCHELSIPLTTLNRYLDEIDVILKASLDLPHIERQGYMIKLSNKPKSGYRNELLLIVLQTYLTNSYAYQIIQLILSKKNIAIEEACQIILISQAHLLRIIYKLNTVLKKHNLMIRTQHNKLYLDGDIISIFLFSFLIYDYHTKIFKPSPNSEKIKETNLYQQFILSENKSKFNSANYRRAENFNYFIKTYLSELNQLTFSDLETKELLKIVSNGLPLYNPATVSFYKNEVTFNFITFLTNMLFTELRLKEMSIKGFQSIITSSHPFIKKVMGLAKQIEKLLPDLTTEQQVLFHGEFLLYFVYYKLYPSDLKRLFATDNLIQYARHPDDYFSYLSLAEEVGKGTIQLPKDCLVTDIFIDNLTVFNHFINIFYYSIHRKKLFITLDFENNMAFENSLKTQLNYLFNNDTIIINNSCGPADLIISDQLYYSSETTNFFYLPDPFAKSWNKSLLAYISSVYFDKMMEETKEN